MITTKGPYDKDNWWTQTSKEEIETCLNCERPTCNDCLGRAPVDRTNHGNHYKTVDAEIFVKTYNAGLRMQQMADLLGIGYDAIMRRLDWLHLPHHPEDRPEITIETIECLPEWMQKHFTLKGERMA